LNGGRFQTGRKLMRKPGIKRKLQSAGLVAVSLTMSHASFGADAKNGLRLAERWCSACHVVSPNQQLASVFAPSFANIASRSRLGARELAQSLLAPHPQMPDRALSREEAADIAAYLRTLAK
jgi:mono/diheme cytochrome c family protein